MGYWDLWEKVCDALGDKLIVNEVGQYFSSDELKEFTKSLIQDYDLGYYDHDLEEEDEE